MILVPTDFGEPADEALGYAIDLALKVGARLVLLNVIKLAVLGVMEMGAVVTEGAVDSVFAANKAALEHIASRRTEVAVETMIATGEPRDEILRVAKQVRADLIVMGTHGRHGIRRLLLGSVAEAVVRAAPCPVLTLHSATREAA